MKHRPSVKDVDSFSYRESPWNHGLPPVLLDPGKRARGAGAGRSGFESNKYILSENVNSQSGLQSHVLALELLRLSIRQ